MTSEHSHMHSPLRQKRSVSPTRDRVVNLDRVYQFTTSSDEGKYSERIDTFAKKRLDERREFEENYNHTLSFGQPTALQSTAVFQSNSLAKQGGKKFVYLPREEIKVRDDELQKTREINMQLKSDLNKALSEMLTLETKLLKTKSLKSEVRQLQAELMNFKKIAEAAKQTEELLEANESQAKQL